VQGHGVYFAERDMEPAGERNSASDRAKCGCGVGGECCWSWSYLIKDTKCILIRLT
jgi:hypothetical protein